MKKKQMIKQGVQERTAVGRKLAKARTNVGNLNARGAKDVDGQGGLGPKKPQTPWSFWEGCSLFCEYHSISTGRQATMPLPRRRAACVGAGGYRNPQPAVRDPSGGGPQIGDGYILIGLQARAYLHSAAGPSLGLVGEVALHWVARCALLLRYALRWAARCTLLLRYAPRCDWKSNGARGSRQSWPKLAQLPGLLHAPPGARLRLPPPPQRVLAAHPPQIISF